MSEYFYDERLEGNVIDVEQVITVNNDEYGVTAISNGPKGKGTRLLFYKSEKDVALKADFALEFNSMEEMCQWFMLNGQMAYEIMAHLIGQEGLGLKE